MCCKISEQGIYNKFCISSISSISSVEAVISAMCGRVDKEFGRLRKRESKAKVCFYNVFITVHVGTFWRCVGGEEICLWSVCLCECMQMMYVHMCVYGANRCHWVSSLISLYLIV